MATTKFEEPIEKTNTESKKDNQHIRRTDIVSVKNHTITYPQFFRRGLGLIKKGFKIVAKP